MCHSPCILSIKVFWIRIWLVPSYWSWFSCSRSWVLIGAAPEKNGEVVFGTGAESMESGQLHSIAAPAPSASTYSEMKPDLYPHIDLGFFAWGPEFWFERFLSFIGEEAFGAGAESMTVRRPHSVAVPASLALMFSESEWDLYPHIDLRFFLKVLSLDWSSSWVSSKNQRSLNWGSWKIWSFRISVTRRCNIFWCFCLSLWSLMALGSLGASIDIITLSLLQFLWMNSILWMKQFLQTDGKWWCFYNKILMSAFNTTKKDWYMIFQGFFVQIPLIYNISIHNS